jgi:hypothetical protein
MPVSPDQFRSSLRAVPFVPFRIHLVDQRSFDVPHPEFVMLVPSGRTAYVVPPGLDAAEVVDVSLIVSLQPITPPAAGTRAA